MLRLNTIMSHFEEEISVIARFWQKTSSRVCFDREKMLVSSLVFSKKTSSDLRIKGNETVDPLTIVIQSRDDREKMLVSSLVFGKKTSSDLRIKGNETVDPLTIAIQSRDDREKETTSSRACFADMIFTSLKRSKNPAKLREVIQNLYGFIILDCFKKFARNFYVTCVHKNYVSSKQFRNDGKKMTQNNTIRTITTKNTIMNTTYMNGGCHA